MSIVRWNLKEAGCLGNSFADDLAMQLAGTDKERAILKAIFNIGGEGLEETIGTYEDAFISRLWNGDDRGVWQTIQETTPDALQSNLKHCIESTAIQKPRWGNMVFRWNEGQLL